MADRKAKRRQRARDRRLYRYGGARRLNLTRARLAVAGGLLVTVLVVGGILLFGTSPSAQSPEASTALSGSANVSIGTKIGERIPEFTMRLADRSMQTSQNLVSTGKPVFMYFFATW